VPDRRAFRRRPADHPRGVLVPRSSASLTRDTRLSAPPCASKSDVGLGEEGGPRRWRRVESGAVRSRSLPL